MRYTYDINGTTNYNQELEERNGLDGMAAIAKLAASALAGAGTSAGMAGTVA